MTTIEAIECAFPARCLTNQELKQDHPDWDFERLEKRTGVFTRYVAADNETALDFARKLLALLERLFELHTRRNIFEDDDRTGLRA